MQEKDIFITLNEPESLIQDDYYFKYIFKKTEKIVCAVFYVVSLVRKNKKDITVVSAIEQGALETLLFAGSILSDRRETARHSLEQLAKKLVLLESELRILHASGGISSDHLDVFIAEIDTAVRSIRGMDSRERLTRNISAGKERARSERTTPHPGIAQAAGDRKERIRAILQAQPGASIKDISDTITDCSEKTIQRELNDMIANGIVVREGEKRWSKYSLI